MHRFPFHFHFKVFSSFFCSFQNAKGNLLNRFRFYKILDQDQKCFADNFGLWPCDKNLPYGKRPQKGLTICLQCRKGRNTGWDKHKLIFPKLSHHTLLRVCEYPSRIFLCYKAKYLSTHKLFF